MSRTFRRKNVIPDRYFTHDWVSRFDSCNWISYIYVKKEGKDLTRGVARFHSEGATHNCKEPGPAWYRRITRQIPLRRSSKEQLRKYLYNEEFEVIIEEKPPPH